MDNFLNKALDQNNTIIIPGFGALTITSARTRDIYFIPYLKHDDGTLNKIISESTGNDVETSKLYLKEYVVNIIQSLEDYSNFEITDFGRFKKTPSGEIEFEKWSDYHKPEIPKKTPIKKVNKDKISFKKEGIVNKEEPIEANKLETYQPEITQNNLDKILNESTSKQVIINQEISEIVQEIKRQEEIDSVLINEGSENIGEKNIIEESAIQTSDEIVEGVEKIDISNLNVDLDRISVNNKIIEEENNNKQKTKSKRKSKKVKTEIIEDSIVTGKNEIHEKKKKKLLPLLLICIAIISGGISFFFYTSKNEKINLKDETNHKEIKAEIVKIEEHQVKKDPVKKEKIESKSVSSNQKTASNSIKKIIPQKKQQNKVQKNQNKKEENKNINSNSSIVNEPNSINKKEIKQIEIKKNNRPSKKELKEADEIVSQLNTNKKNSEAVNSIKTTAITKSKDNINKNIESTNEKNMNQITSNVPSSKTVQPNDKKGTNQTIITTTNPTTKNSITNQTTITSSKQNLPTTQNTVPTTPVKNTVIQSNPKTSTVSTIPSISTPKNTTIPNNSKNVAANQANTNIKSNAITQSTTNIKTTNQSNSKITTTQTTNTKNTIVENNTNVKKVGTTTPTVVKTNKKIELIAETFKDKSSAEKMATKLKDGGYKNTRIEEKDGQFNVIIDSYNTLSETVKELKKYRSQ